MVDVLSKVSQEMMRQAQEEDLEISESDALHVVRKKTISSLD